MLCDLLCRKRLKCTAYSGIRKSGYFDQRYTYAGDERPGAFKAVKERSPETEIILLTGYAEFEYAKQALSLGIRQYLLKPFRFEDIESALLSCIHSLDNLESRRRQQTYIQEKLQLISPLLTEQIYQDLLEGRIGDYSEKIAACNIKDALYVVISTQSDFPGSSLDIALYAQIKELLNGMEPEVYLAQGIDIISCILCFNAKHSLNFVRLPLYTCAKCSRRQRCRNWGSIFLLASAFQVLIFLCFIS